MGETLTPSSKTTAFDGRVMIVAIIATDPGPQNSTEDDDEAINSWLWDCVRLGWGD